MLGEVLPAKLLMPASIQIPTICHYWFCCYDKDDVGSIFNVLLFYIEANLD